MTVALDKELDTYKRELPNMLASEGKFALIQGDKVIGVYDTYQDAIQTGYDKLGLQPFLVKRIQAVEQVQCFTRAIGPCRT